MSLQWTFIATFLYVEIFLVALFLLPFISPVTWQRVFRSRLLNAFRSYANLYFNIFILILIVLFLDSIRDVRRYQASSDDVSLQTHPNAEAVAHMKLFRSQRNFYIAGFALFLFLVLRRMVTLISAAAVLIADGEAARKQAESASKMAEQLMEQKDNKDNEKEASAASSDALEVTKKELTQTKQELDRAKLDLDTMRKQAESTNKEYDRLLKEHGQLQAQVDAGDKKSD